MMKPQAHNFLKDKPSSIQKMKDQSPFTRLPYEVIEHILTFLDYESLLQCSLTSKLFTDVVDTSLKLMKRFTLFVNTSYYKGFKDIGFLRRRHAKIVIDDIDFEEVDFMESALRKIGQNVREAHIRCHISPDHPWILDYFPNVRKLEVDGYLHIQPATSSMLTNLTELRIKKPENIALFENVRSLQKLQVVIDEEAFGSFNRLLNNQSSIDLLFVKINGRPSINHMRLSLNDDFKVRRLFISFYASSALEIEKLLKLAMDFKSQIEGLSLEGLEDVMSPMVLDKVLENFRTISALRLDISWLPSRKEFYTSVKANARLTDLVFTSFDGCFFNGVRGLIGLFKIFPNLQHLTIPYIESVEVLKEAVEIPELNVQFRKRKSFTVAVRKASGITLPTSTLSLVTSLFIDYNDCRVPLDVFSSSFPSLREISISSFTSGLDLECFLQSLPELQSLRLGYGFCLTLKALEIIKRCAPSLKTLHVCRWDGKISLQGALMALDIKGLEVIVAKGSKSFDVAFSLRSSFDMK